MAATKTPKGIVGFFKMLMPTVANPAGSHPYFANAIFFNPLISGFSCFFDFSFHNFGLGQLKAIKKIHKKIIKNEIKK